MCVLTTVNKLDLQRKLTIVRLKWTKQVSRESTLNYAPYPLQHLPPIHTRQVCGALWLRRKFGPMTGGKGQSKDYQEKERSNHALPSHRVDF